MKIFNLHFLVTSYLLDDGLVIVDNYGLWTTKGGSGVLVKIFEDENTLAGLSRETLSIHLSCICQLDDVLVTFCLERFLDERNTALEI